MIDVFGGIGGGYGAQGKFHTDPVTGTSRGERSFDIFSRLLRERGSRLEERRQRNARGEQSPHSSSFDYSCNCRGALLQQHAVSGPHRPTAHRFRRSVMHAHARSALNKWQADAT